jgi:hypothetical protein
MPKEEQRHSLHGLPRTVAVIFVGAAVLAAGVAWFFPLVGL